MVTCVQGDESNMVIYIEIKRGQGCQTRKIYRLKSTLQLQVEKIKCETLILANNRGQFKSFALLLGGETRFDAEKQGKKNPKRSS